MRQKGLITLLIISTLLTGCSTNELSTEKASASISVISAAEIAERIKDTASEISVPGSEKKVPEWSWAYADYIDSVSEIYGDDPSVSYMLIYLDDNDVPELFISTGMEASGEVVATYYDGKVMDCLLSRIGSTYIERSGLVCTDTGHMDYYPIYITKLENGVFSQMAEGLRYLSDENRKTLANDPDAEYVLSYEWENIAVSEEEFYDHLAEYYDTEQAIYPDTKYSREEILSVLRTGVWTSYGHKYELIQQDISWQEAAETCKQRGGYLATITSPDEAAFIADQIADKDMADICFYAGYRFSEWVGDDFLTSRWINADGSYTLADLYDLSEYHAPDKEELKSKWRTDYDKADCGLVKYCKELNQIFVYDAPDVLLDDSPEYHGRMGFICEYDN